MTTSYTTRLGNAPEEGIKAPCVASTTANITLTAEQTIDTVAVVAGNRVLVKNQTDATENGIYAAAVGAWTRTKDFNNANDVVNGVVVVDANSGEVYQAVFTGSWTPDTTSITFISQAFSTKLSKAGDTATGQIKGITPVSAADFTRKDYVDDADALRLPLAGGTLTGQAKGITPSSAEDLTRKDYVDDADALKLNLTGGTLTGQAKGITPVAAEDLARKDYVDTMIPKAGGTATGQIKGITPVADEDFVRKDYSDSNRVGARVELSHSVVQPVGVGGTLVVAWDTEITDEASSHDDVTNNTRITISSSYNRIRLHCYIGCTYDTAITDGRVAILYRKNGSYIKWGETLAFPERLTQISNASTGWIDCATNDYFEIVASNLDFSVDCELDTDVRLYAELIKV